MLATCCQVGRGADEVSAAGAVAVAVASQHAPHDRVSDEEHRHVLRQARRVIAMELAEFRQLVGGQNRRVDRAEERLKGPQPRPVHGEGPPPPNGPITTNAVLARHGRPLTRWTTAVAA